MRAKKWFHVALQFEHKKPIYLLCVIIIVIIIIIKHRKSVELEPIPDFVI